MSGELLAYTKIATKLLGKLQNMKSAFSSDTKWVPLPLVLVTPPSDQC